MGGMELVPDAQDLLVKLIGYLGLYCFHMHQVGSIPLGIKGVVLK